MQTLAALGFACAGGSACRPCPRTPAACGGRKRAAPRGHRTERLASGCYAPPRSGVRVAGPKSRERRARGEKRRRRMLERSAAVDEYFSSLYGPARMPWRPSSPPIRQRICRRSMSVRCRAGCCGFWLKASGEANSGDRDARGYSTLWLAGALPGDGQLITLESNARHAKVARGNFERAGCASASSCARGRH